jgi:hypothetical protein
MATVKYDVQACLRPFTPRDVQVRQEEVLERIESLAADGLVKASVVWWSPKVCLPKTDNPLSAGCPEIVCELVEFAEVHDLSLEPYVREHAGIAPGEDDSLVLPVICLVVRESGTICGLYPFAHEGTKYTVEDGLRALETGGDVANVRKVTSV